MKGLCLASLAFLLFSACVDADISLAFASGGTVTLEASLRLSSVAAPLISRDFRGAAGPARPGLSLPLSRSAMDEFLLSQPGVRLLSWSFAEAQGIMDIEASFSFESAQTAVAFLSSLGLPATLADSGARRTISLDMDRAVAKAVDQGARNGMPESLERLYDGWDVVLAVQAPRRVLSAKGGRSTGNRAEFAVPLLDLALQKSPQRWEVQW